MPDMPSMESLLGVETVDDLRGVARDDLLDAHARAWDWIAGPGTWLTGAERLAVVREVRQAAECDFCQARKDALSPLAVEGEHDHLGELDLAAVEAIHRVATDSGRLSASWVDGLLADGLSDGAYIEIAGLTAMTKMMDAFAWAADVEPPPLPQPRDGAASGYRPPGAKKSDAWVAVVKLEDVSETDGPLYGATAGGVHQALSLVPDSKRAFWALGEPHYIPMDEIRNTDTRVRAISRAQIEILAGRTSALHQCMY